MNICTFTGRLAADATLKSLNDTQVCNFRLASDVGYGDRKTTLWLECALWGKRGETLSKYLGKGSQVTVVGELSTREYEKDGEKRLALGVRVSDIALQGRGSDAAPATPQKQKEPRADYGEFYSEGTETDEVPF